MPNICTKFLIWISSWNDYKNVGTVIPGTRFIAFKVPVLDHPEWNLDELKKLVPELQHIIDLNGNTSSSIFDKGRADTAENSRKYLKRVQNGPPKNRQNRTKIGTHHYF